MKKYNEDAVCAALIKRSVASLMLENLTARSKKEHFINSCVDVTLRCYFIDHLKMTPKLFLRSCYTLSACMTSSFQLFPSFTMILTSLSWDVPLCLIIFDGI